MGAPRVRQIVDAVIASLAGIGGDGGASYWFTPDAVVDVADLSLALLDTTVAAIDPVPGDPPGPTIYAVLPVRWPREPVTNRESLIEFTFDLALCKRLNFENEAPLPTGPDPNRFTLQARMAQDVEKRLCGGDLTLGVPGVENARIFEWDVSPENTFVEGWAIAFGRASVTCRYLRDQP